MDLTVLTPADLDVLRGLIYRERNRPKNTVNRGATPEYEDNPPPTTEVYIAKVPALGIPALTENLLSSTGDVPGSRVCNIYKIRMIAGTPRLQPVTDPAEGMTRTVYNLSLQEIVEADVPYVAIKREKFGSWLADGGMSVGTGGESVEEPECGFLVLNCPEDGPGTGSDVYVPGTGTPNHGYLSPCNDGEIVLVTIHLTVAFGADAVSVAMVSTDGNSWTYAGPTIQVGSCASLRVMGAVLSCDPPWVLDLALEMNGMGPFSFRYPAGLSDPDWVMVTSVPLYWTYADSGTITVACGTHALEMAITE